MKCHYINLCKIAFHLFYFDIIIYALYLILKFILIHILYFLLFYWE